MATKSRRVCIDVGGTFTDCLVLDEAGALSQFKAPTTPADPSRGFMDSLEKAAGHFDLSLGDFLASIEVLVHGTTLATNTLLTGTGAKLGMLTTKEFPDILEMRRGIKPVELSLYNVFIPPNEPLVPRHRRMEVEERTLYTGEIQTPLNEAEVEAAVADLKAEGVEAIAICFLHSYANGENELRAAEIVEKTAPEIYVSTSHETLPVWREFERYNTTAVGAYIGPAVAHYLAALEERLKTTGFGGTFLLMLTNGMVQTLDYCRHRGIYLLHSGPAAAPAAAVYLGGLLGTGNLLSVDMGGTSFDVCLVQGGEIPTTTENWQADQRIGIKMVDIRTVGAGGGSIANIDALGLLKVGPESAGADPGPACYGQSTLPTVTDADLVLGYIPDDYFLGGEMEVDPELSRKSMKIVGGPLGLDEMDTAQAIFDTVNTTMAHQITQASTKQGYDVRDFQMVAGGGGGAIHAGFIAEFLDIPKVLIPSVSALYSAFGMFAMDLGQDYVRTCVSRLGDVDPATVDGHYRAMEEEARTAFAAIGVSAGDLTLRRTVEMRYIGQLSEVEVEMATGDISQAEITAAAAAFGDRHKELYTFSMPWKGVEMLNLRLKATAPKVLFNL
ncbi:MAG: hydantoinase/oxoprolinase family protein, partial [Rhodospirillales bacterium]|nr:hydantoinase/oxoprolinase family protein [Rhodospirillales bacterium]